MVATDHRGPDSAGVVLVVEDDDGLALAISKILEREGLQTLIAGTGAEAIEQLASGLPTLMLVDYSLSDTRADRLIERLASAGKRIPFIVATGHGSETIAVEMMKRGARDYLVKDGSFLQLLPTVVKRVLAEVQTEQRLDRAEHALRDSEERFRTVVEASGAGIWSWDLVRGEGFWSEQLYEILGVDSHSPPWDTDTTLANLHPDDRALLVERVQRHLTEESPLRLEARLRRADRYVWLSVNGKAQRDSTGRPVRIAGSVLDITDRKQTAEALRQSEERYRSLVEHAPDAIYVSQAGRLVFVNAATLKLFGAESAEQLLGRSVLELVDLEYLPRVQERLRELYEHGRSVPLMEQKLCRLDGRSVDVEVVATPCLYDNRPAAQVIVRDISERKQAEAQAREHQTQLAHVMRVNTMGKMVSELAHEVNQPLYAISNYASACRELLSATDTNCPEDVVSWVDHIADQANRAGEIIRHVGGFVRKNPPSRSTVALSDLLRDIVRLLELDARAHDCRVQLIAPPAACLVLIDRVQIEQVVVNLVLNAIEAMGEIAPASRQVTIECLAQRNAIEVTVRDEGQGVHGNDIEQLFEPFFTTKPSGMGMGLAISRSIVDSHGGRLWATANDVRGMTFRFTLPQADTKSARG
jgi:two-component system, LuxR family, sensor kinase FixL